MAPLSCGRPSLDAFEDLGTNVLIDGSWTDGFQQGDKVVHELSGGNLGEEVLAPILDTGICKLHRKLAMTTVHVGALGAAGSAYVQCAQLGIWVLVADAFLQRAHGVFRWNGLGSDDVGYLEVESYVLSANTCHRISGCPQLS